jgi:transketolase
MNNNYKMTSIDKQALCTQIRRDILRMVHAVQSGHPGGSLGCVEYFVSLYFDVLKQNDSFDMQGHNEDIFYLSNGHISPVWYSTMARKGYFPVSELNTFRKLNTRLQGHPTTAEHLEGVRVASGSLGQGLSVACGTALSKKMNQDPNFVFVLMGDGELQEGQVWEAALFAAHHKINNLIATVDVNGQQIDGTVDSVLSLGDLKTKWESFGWKVILANGNNYDEISETLRRAKHVPNNEKPIIILMQTIMGKGVDFMENSHKWHGSPPSTEQLELALAQLPSELGDY